MKKFIVFILAFLYLGVSSGIAMEIHYCMGERTSVDFFGKHKNDDRCGKCGMKEKKGGCCSDEHQFYKVNDAHKQVSNEFCFDCFSSVIDLPNYDYDGTVSDQLIPGINPYHAPPPDLSGADLCIRFCIFRL